MLHDCLIVSVLMFGSETKIRKGKERSRIIVKLNRILNARVRELYGVKMGGRWKD